MSKEMTQRQTEILNRYPSIKKTYEELCIVRRNEIIEELLESDIEYQTITQRRAEASQSILKNLSKHGMTSDYEAYSDAVHVEETYELDVIYKQAFFDAIETMEQLQLL